MLGPLDEKAAIFGERTVGPLTSFVGLTLIND